MAALTRRNFLKTSAAAAAVASMTVPHVHAAGDETIRIALVGCGGRGRGACFQALKTQEGPVELVAIADAFEDQAKGFAQVLKADEEVSKRCAFTDDTIFWGLDAYKKAIDCLRPGDLVLLVAPGAFRSLHFEYAVQKGVHVFLEKPFGVDTPTLKRALAAWKVAQQKNLKVITGLNNRKAICTEETVKMIQDGAIGDILSCWVYRFQTNTCSYNPRPEWTPLQCQLRNYNSFSWISGTPTVDWMVHNLDICCWCKGEHPTWVQGTGGRQSRTVKDELLDHISCEYVFDDGVRMMMQTRFMPNTWTSFRAVIQGSKGSALLGEGEHNPRIFKGYHQVPEDVVWKAPTPWNDSYQEEHNRLAKMIRQDLPSEDVDFCLKSCFTGIMGRMAMESGQEVTWDAAWNSTYALCPDLDNLDFNGPSYIMPNENGEYESCKPGLPQWKRF
ncbi:MAG: Gfo/Idh/MocA family protein [Thermoguttaceae bacterium]